MKETVKISNDTSLMSEVEKNKNLIRVGDEIFNTYGDCATHTVTELFEGGFTSICDGIEDNFYFEELQIEWYIKDRTKENHVIYDRFTYEN